MTEVGFYHLRTTALERVLPRLLTKAHESGMKAVVLAATPERVDSLNALLWTFDQGSFLPHGGARDGNAGEQPIYLTIEEENPADATLLVCVDGVEPGYLDDFERCLDVFDGNDETAVTAARARWTRLKEAGHDLTYWQQTEAGGWEKKD
jgi:DNA polymerase-3 subunit chi